MKLSIAATVLLPCIRMGEAAEPKLLRANVKTAFVEEVSEAKKKEAKTASDSVPPARERISEYVRNGQMFFIMDPSIDALPLLYENPSKEPVMYSAVYWFCKPTTAPDLNGDGQYDSVVSHVNTYRASSTVTSTSNAGATGNDVFTTHGYAASWVKEGGYYNERVVDFGDATVWQIIGNEIQGYETSPPGGTGGLVACE